MAIMQLGKKGMFLTFISIVIIAAAIIIFTPNDTNLNEDLTVTKTRASKVNEYVLDLKNVYLERALYSSGRNTIMALIEYMNESQTFFADFDEFKDSFSQVLLNGTIGEPAQYIDDIIDPLDLEPDIIKNNAYNDWLDKINETAYDTYGVDTYFGINIDNVYVDQTHPWAVNISADVSFNVTSETASWNKTVRIQTEIDIEGLNDPYYLVKTSGNYENKIRRSFSLSGDWGVEEMMAFIRPDGNYTYFGASQAPSFLMRFYDDITPSSCCGIESIVNPDTLSTLGLPSDLAMSYVDYKFFPSFSTPPPCDEFTSPTLYTETVIETEFPDIKFDSSDLNRYGISSSPNIEQRCPPP